MGYCAGGVGRAMLVGGIGLVLGLVFAGVHIVHPVLMILVALIASLMFSLGGFLNGLFSKTFDDTTIITTFVLSPLIYLSGIFYSVDQLPGFWREVSLFNPLHYFIDIFRYSMLGGSASSGGHIKISFLIIILFTLFLLFFNLILMRRSAGLRG